MRSVNNVNAIMWRIRYPLISAEPKRNMRLGSEHSAGVSSL